MTLPGNKALLAAAIIKEGGTPWLTVLAVAAATIALILVLRAARYAMHRCVFCGDFVKRLAAMRSFKAERILRSLAEYEGTDVRPKNIMICHGCQTVYDCTPRAYAIMGASRLSREQAVAAGVKLQVGDFGCHKCGNTLAESDSPSLSAEDRILVEEAARRAGCEEPRMRLFCNECKTVHLWVPLTDTGYRSLRAEESPVGGDIRDRK